MTMKEQDNQLLIKKTKKNVSAEDKRQQMIDQETERLQAKEQRKTEAKQAGEDDQES